jgi:hypothetical protein
MKQSIIILLLSGVLFSCNNSGSNPSANDSTGTGTNTTDTAANKPMLLLNLPDSCNTPDGLALGNDSTILLSMPNHNDPSYKSHIYKIVGNALQLFTDLPVEPSTGHVCPMDLAFGPDGNVYINDNQYELYDKNYKSRLLKVTMQGGKPVSVTPIVTGFRLANGMVWKGNDLYITDSQWDTPQDTTKSAVFHFTLAQLSGSPIKLQPGFNNPYILDTFTTHFGEDKIDNGVDGIDYDSKGNLYTGLFGDGTVYKITLDEAGKSTGKKELVAKGPIASVDGFIIDRRTDKLYICDAKKNAIKIVDANGQVSTLWENGDTDGGDGGLDQPAEIMLVGNKLYISSFDKPMGDQFVNKKYDKPNTVSVITLP